jgi:hypothetical protein
MNVDLAPHLPSFSLLAARFFLNPAALFLRITKRNTKKGLAGVYTAELPTRDGVL